ncbi:E3 ubiquitin-protein ligase pellino homolog 1 isoform X3 [Coregonus clupeaformis]|uniref:E3 ubiquitin-protein ligase pellino homolog 1 isoform X3 n=1 Tax=Coregonus clupeaformis TaxID=59861 RepID=UPI001BE08323|nr:E3 ubiquitin-protein ligase pellino homolog 1 isoform X3 [Coregonus clupeaformis]
MVLEGSSEALCPPPSLELRPSCNKSQPLPPLGSCSTPHDGLFPGDKEPVKYGELIVLGHNGSLVIGDKGRRRSRLALYKRPKANGVKPDVIHNVSTPLVSKALSNKSQHSISYTLSRSHSVIVEYTHDTNTDMFQIGRSTESMIDFVVTDTAGSSTSGGGGGWQVQGAAGEGGGGGGGQSAQSTISRYACRIMCERSAPYTARIYAAGFDSSKNIFLGVSQERAAKWRTSDGLMDGLTTNGVLVMHPAGEFVSEPAPGVWREISVCGNVFALRETRSAQQRGKLVENESNTLQDGSLIDLCGATLLWRTPSGLRRTPTLKQLESLRQELNAARPQCPVGFNTLAFPSLAQREIVDKKQPWVYVNCGHVHGYHNWGYRKDKGHNVGPGGTAPASTGERECPMCRCVGPYVPLWLGCEGGLYLDAGPPTHAFCPCGHVCSEKTVAGWSQIPLPHGTHAFHAACPFCGTWLTGEQGHIKLIFQGPVD